MSTWIVTRHAGALEWLAQQGHTADHVVRHLDLTLVQPGDTVIGTLPVHHVAQLNAKGAEYLHLSLDLPPEARGRELTAADLEQCNPRLEALRVTKLPTTGNPDSSS